MNGAGKGGMSIYNNEYFNDEFVLDKLQHNKRGTISMASKGSKRNTNLCQFFIIYSAQPQLDGHNTIFAHLIGDESYQTLGILENLPVDTNDKPLKPIMIEHVKIHANPFAQNALNI